MNDGGNPWFAGWVAWAAFHLNPASETLAVLGLSEKYAAIHYVLMKFCVGSLVARSIDPQRVLYLTEVYYKDKKGNYAYEGNRHPYDEKKAFLLPVTAVENIASSRTALLWIEGGVIEIFCSYNIEGSLKDAVNEVILALPTTWPNSPKFRTMVYNFPRHFLKSSNYWNTYFLFLRTKYSKEQVMRAFSATDSNWQSLEQRRDLVVQTCGRLIADCAEPLNKQGYDGFFGPEGEPFMLSREHILEIHNIYMRCSNTSNKLWNIFANILPDFASGARVQQSEAKAAQPTAPSVAQSALSSFSGPSIRPESKDSGIAYTAPKATATAPSVAVSKGFPGSAYKPANSAENAIPLLVTPGPTTIRPNVIVNPSVASTWPENIDPKYNNFREIQNAKAMVFLSP